jgi:hypothetical protein
MAEVEGMGVNKGGDPTMGSGPSPLGVTDISSPSLPFFSETEPVLELVSISSILSFLVFLDFFLVKSQYSI